MIYTQATKKLANLPEQELKNLLGGKGAGLYKMSRAGIKVPPFLVIPTEMWKQFKSSPATTMALLQKEVQQRLEEIAEYMGYMPLFSVRSGARVSMPGMMDTILNVGLDDSSEEFWRGKLGDSCYTDSLHRLITMYGSVVKGLPRQELEQGDVASALAYYTRKTGDSFPPFQAQVMGAIEAVFNSWSNERAVFYRKMNNIPEDWGTAVVVQAMVFGNLNDNSATGVMFTRNPDTGEDGVVGEFLVNAQGEDVVAGIRTPKPLKEMQDWNAAVAEQVLEVALKLEETARDVQDIEFTVQDGELFILQTRNAKRSAPAAVRIALDLCKEGVLTEAEALKTLTPKILSAACLPQIDPKYKKKPLAVGIPACSGVATGMVVTTKERAVAEAGKGKKVVLVTKETTPDDLEGMHVSEGVLTIHGGSTSHAAVVARSMNKPCVVGLGDEAGNLAELKEGCQITIDGSSGKVWAGAVPIIPGDATYVEQVGRLILGSCVEIGDKAPIYPTESYVLDIGAELMAGVSQLADLIKAAGEKVSKTLYLSLSSMEDTMVYGYYAQFFRATDFSKHVDALLITAIESLPEEIKKKIVLMGKYSSTSPLNKKYKVISMSQTNPTALANITTAEDVLLLPNPKLTAMEEKAIKRISAWLRAEGVNVRLFNVAGSGGFVARSVAAKELLG